MIAVHMYTLSESRTIAQAEKAVSEIEKKKTKKKKKTLELL